MRAFILHPMLPASALALLLSGPAAAQGDEPAAHKLGDHPAVVVQRLQRQAGYDYASKFYPHPAWLRLYAAQPQDEPVRPAAAVASESNPEAAQVARR